MKKRIIYCIYCSIILITLVLGLILIPKLKTDNHANSIGNIYATKIELVCPREIAVEVGTEFKLNTDFLLIEPAEAYSKLNTTITSRVDNTEGIELNNNIITAKELGFYYVKFSVPKTDDYNLVETLVVHVVAQNVKVVQNIDSVEVGDIFKLEDLFSIDPSYEVEIITSSNVEYNNVSLKFLEVGTANFNFVLKNANVSYYYYFNITINPKSEPIEQCVSINLSYNEINCKVNETVVIPYLVVAGEAEKISQAVYVDSDNLDVIEIISADECFIVIKTKKIGETELIITSKLSSLAIAKVIINVK